MQYIDVEGNSASMILRGRFGFGGGRGYTWYILSALLPPCLGGLGAKAMHWLGLSEEVVQRGSSRARCVRGAWMNGIFITFLVY